MNNKGQSLIGALMAITLMMIAMQATISLMVGAARQQASVNRKAAWSNTKTSITQILLNPTACNNTVLNSQSIRFADNSVFVQQGTTLVPTLNITNIYGTLLGPTTTITVPTGCTENGQSGNWKCNFANYTAQQAKITVQAQDKHQRYQQDYYVNVAVDNSGNVLGCI